MKHVLAVMVVAALVALAGCENTQLMECQGQNAALQAQVETANAAVAEKEKQIEKLQAENVDMQNTAMQSITTMMTKQAEKDKQIKDQLAQSQQQVKDLKQQNRVQQQRIEELEKQIAEQQAAVQETAEEAADTATEDSM